MFRWCHRVHVYIWAAHDKGVGGEGWGVRCGRGRGGVASTDDEPPSRGIRWHSDLLKWGATRALLTEARLCLCSQAPLTNWFISSLADTNMAAGLFIFIPILFFGTMGVWGYQGKDQEKINWKHQWETNSPVTLNQLRLSTGHTGSLLHVPTSPRTARWLVKRQSAGNHLTPPHILSRVTAQDHATGN